MSAADGFRRGRRALSSAGAAEAWQLELRDAIEAYRSLFDHATVGIYRVALDRRLAAANPALVRMLGYGSLEELLRTAQAGSPLSVDASRAAKFWELMARDGVVPGFELQFRRKDGTRGWSRAHAWAVRDERGKVRFYEGMVENISDRRAAEFAWSETEGRYQDLFENNPLPMWVTDLKTLGFRVVNEAAIQRYGYSRDEFLRMTLRNIRPPEDIPDLEQRIAALTRGISFDGERRHRTKDGTVIWVDVVARTVRFGGRDAILVALHDVTGRKRAQEAEREARAQLEALSRRLLSVQEAERRELARALHDEIGQELTALQLLLEGAVGPGRTVDMIQLVQELLARVRRTSLNLRPPMLDDLGLLPALRWQVEQQVAAVGVSVEFTHAGLDRRFERATETAAFRIVQEALTNIIRHAGVRAAKIHVAANVSRLVVDVVDTGTGFDVAKTAATSAGGLAGMQERAQLLGGSVTVDSVAGGGTQVHAVLPLKRPTIDQDADDSTGR